jgi:hypothetical protein
MKNDTILNEIRIEQETQAYSLQYPSYSMMITSEIMGIYSEMNGIIPKTYTAVSNVCFAIFDYISGIYGRAGGIGKSEREALDMCLANLNKHVKDTHYSEYNKRKLFMTEDTTFSYADLKPIPTCKRLITMWDVGNESNSVFAYYQEALYKKAAKRYEYISSIDSAIRYVDSVEELISDVLQRIDPNKRYEKEVGLARLKNQKFYSTDRFLNY